MDDAEIARNKRVEMKDLKEKIKVGQVFLSRFEKSRIIGARALQISYGAPILTDIPENEIDPLWIAEEELNARVLPITIRRKLPDETYQNIPVHWLLLD